MPTPRLKIPDFQEAMKRYSATMTKNVKKVFTETIPTIKEVNKQVFDEGQTEWRDLTPGYIKTKARKGWRPEKLRRTDRFYNAMTAGTGDTERTITSDTLRYGLTGGLYGEYVKYSQGDGRVNRFFTYKANHIAQIRRKIIDIVSGIEKEARKAFRNMKKKEIRNSFIQG